MAPKIDPTTGQEVPEITVRPTGTDQGAGGSGETAAQRAAREAQLTGQQSGSNQGQGSNNDWLSNEDLNGECFVSGEIGELEERLNYREVVFPFDCPSAAVPFEAVRFTSNQAEIFIKVNHRHLTSIKTGMRNEDAVKIVFLRFLAARTGLISPKFETAAHFVRYNEAIQMTQVETVTAIAAATTNVRALLDEKTRHDLQKNFSNIVCCVAYMFRVRGHHFIPDMKTKYQDLWKRCQKSGDHPGVDWEVIAHDALHAIMPDVLDDYWVACCTEGKIAGALVKRLDSAPAGVAAIRAVYAGAEDLRMAIPGIYTKFKTHFDELDNLVLTLRKNRWAGSINRRYYGPGAVAIDFNEQRFGAIAAVVVNCLQAFAQGSHLLESKALKRISDNAPITGGFISAGIAALSKDPSITKAMLEVSHSTV